MKFLRCNWFILNSFGIPLKRLLLFLALGTLASISSILIIYLIYTVSSHFFKLNFFQTDAQPSQSNFLARLFIDNPLLLIYTTILNMFIQISTVFYLQKFAQDVSHIISTSILRRYLEMPSIKRESDLPEKVRSLIASEAQQYATMIIMPFLEISKSSILLLIGAISIVVNLPSYAMASILVSGVIFVLYYFLTRRIIRRLGLIRSQAVENRLSLTEGSINNLIYIKAYNAVQRIYDNFYIISQKLHSGIVWSMLISNLPKYIIEAVIFFMISLGIIYIDFTKSDSENGNVSGLMLAGLIALRVLPELQRVFNGFARLNYGQSISQQILQIIKTLEPHHMHMENRLRVLENQNSAMLSLRNVQIFGAQGQKLFDPISLDVHPGEIAVFKGRSGIGKSSVFEAIMGFRAISNGSLKFFNNQNGKYFSYVGQKPLLLSGSIENLYQVMVGDNNQTKMHDFTSYALQLGLISDYLEIKSFFNKSVDVLSGGELQRLTIVFAVLSDHSLILLDEPTSSLDEGSKDKVVRLISQIAVQNEKIILIISHDGHFDTVSDKMVNLKCQF